MEYKQKIEWLSRYIKEKEAVDELIRRTRNKLTTCKVQIITDMTMGSGGASDKIGNGVCNLERLYNFADEIEDKNTGVRLEIEVAIMAVGGRESIILAKKYIEGMTYRQTASYCKCSIIVAKRLHKLGIDKLCI